MIKFGIAEILEKANACKTKKEKIEFLRKWDSPVLRKIIQHAFDPNIKFLLPEGKPPYRASDLVEDTGMLYTEARKLYLFVEGGNTNLTPQKREMLFIGLLETVNQKDAELLIAVKDKTLPYKTLTKKLITEAFPGLLS